MKQFKLRISDDLHARLVSAQGAGSLNSEIIARLEATLQADVIRDTIRNVLSEEYGTVIDEPWGPFAKGDIVYSWGVVREIEPPQNNELNNAAATH